MRRDARKRRQKKEEKRGAAQVLLPLAAVVGEDLRAFVLAKGLESLAKLLEQEREQLCGPAYERGGERGAVRAGSAPGRLVLGGRRVTVKRPRVRCGGREMPLQAWSDFAGEDPLDERAYEQMLVGVSTRNYDRSLEPISDELKGHGTSKSAVSRRFVRRTRTAVQQWMRRDLSDLRLAVVMIDGIVVDDHVIIIAVGIDHQGAKHVLGLAEGATENADACTALLSDLVDRGLPAQRSLLFVIDGSKALRRAIRDVFGRRARVQRCQLHKRKNVLGHLPTSMHRVVGKQLSDAYSSRTKSTAKRRIQALARHLEADHPGAAASLREGLDETLTVLALSLPPLLRKSLTTTNIIENLNNGIRFRIRRVKRWRDGQIVLRWVTTTVLEAQTRFKRIKGYRSMPVLVDALRKNDMAIYGGVDVMQDAA